MRRATSRVPRCTSTAGTTRWGCSEALRAGLQDHVHRDERDEDHLDAGVEKDPLDPRLDLGVHAASLVDQLADASGLRAEEERARDERQRPGDDREHGPELPLPVTLEHEDEAEHDEDERRRHERAHADELDVFREAGDPGAVALLQDAEGEELDHERAADPDDRHQDVQRLPCRVPAAAPGGEGDEHADERGDEPDRDAGARGRGLFDSGGSGLHAAGGYKATRTVSRISSKSGSSDVSYAHAARTIPSEPTRKTERAETSRRPRKSKATPKPRVASPLKSESRGKSRSRAWVHATCVHGWSREMAYGCAPAARNSSLLSRRSSSSLVQVEDQSKR